MSDYETNDRREQRQQPRFNRREFLAQQAASQGGDASVPLTTSREDRAAYQPQTERPTRPPREDRPQRPHRDPDMTVAQYREELAKIKWLFLTPSSEQSFFGVIESMEQQIKLYNAARRLTPDHLRAFVSAQQSAFYDAQRDALAKQAKEKLDYFDALEKTGDQELDSFRTRCRNHDWTWRYTDDASVARAAEANEETLLAIVKEKGGLYEAYYALCVAYFCR